MKRKLSNAIKSSILLSNIDKVNVSEKLNNGVKNTGETIRRNADDKTFKSRIKKAVKAVLKGGWKVFKPCLEPFLRPFTNRLKNRILLIIENSYLAAKVNEISSAVAELTNRIDAIGGQTGGSTSEDYGEDSCAAKPYIIIIGAGGHAKVVAEVIAANNDYNIAGFLDSEKQGDILPDISVIGDDAMLPELFKKGIKTAAVAVGDNKLREKIAEKIIKMGFELPAIIHPKAFISPTAKIGGGTVVMPGAIIETLACIEEFAIINTGAIVEHNNIIRRYAHIAPGCSLAGSVRVGERTIVGAGSSVIPNIAIGRDVIVGAGSSVVKDVPDGAVIGGVPAKIIK